MRLRVLAPLLALASVTQAGALVPGRPDRIVQVFSPAALAAAVLYGLGGISAEVFINALGGFVMPHLLD